MTVTLSGLAERVNGEALVRCGDTVVFAVATMSEEESSKDFFPLSVNYEEKFYAAGKISGPRYTRREGRPSDRATLVSRMIDRAIRPRFTKDLKNEVQVIVTCLSWDEKNDPSVAGLIASSLALHLSDIPWEGPLGAVQIGLLEEGGCVINPSYEQKKENGKMEMVVSGFFKENEFTVNMIEGSFKEESEKAVAKAIGLAENPIKEICAFQEKIRKAEGKEKVKLPDPFEDGEVKKAVEKEAREEMKNIFSLKDNREKKLKELKKKVSDFIKEKYEEEKKVSFAFACLEKIIEEEIRRNILEKEDRIDGRKIDEVREINCSVGLLPRTHGSALFSRGQTKALSVITLGAPGEQQLMEEMEVSDKKRFMHHYNFPPYSVGEVRPIRSPGRREIGHGMLGENSLLPLLPDPDDFPYTIRSVSEIVSSNGSTSMASVCSASLAFMDAGIPIKRPVAGISIGLVTDKESGKYKLLTDIQGTEDHYGDMDFKVAGTEKGITVIQMDVKIDGLTKKMIEDSLERARKTRLYLLGEMKKVIEKPRESLSPFAPRIVTLKIDPEKIGDVIGPRGKTINEIIDGTNVAIDIDDSGLISITSENDESIEKAVSWIKNITREIKEGEIFQGKVVKLFGFGAVVEIVPGQEGLVHISEIADRRVKSVEDELKPGEIVPVKVIKVEDSGKISLSIRRAKEKTENK